MYLARIFSSTEADVEGLDTFLYVYFSIVLRAYLNILLLEISFFSVSWLFGISFFSVSWLFKKSFFSVIRLFFL